MFIYVYKEIDYEELAHDYGGVRSPTICRVQAGDLESQW